jgi:hypothetical protein
MVKWRSVASLQGKRREKPSEFIRENCTVNKVMNKWRLALSI